MSSLYKEKVFIDANTLLVDSFKLAKKIYRSGFIPDFIVGLWRGGSLPGISIHEFFVYKTNRFIPHNAIKTESYFGIGKQKEVSVDGLGKIIPRIKIGDKLLIVDDIFDSGRTLEKVKDTITKLKNNEIKIATIYYKPRKNKTKYVPDYFLKEVSEWIVFPHELEGLSEEELKQKGFGISDILMED